MDEKTFETEVTENPGSWLARTLWNYVKSECALHTPSGYRKAHLLTHGVCVFSRVFGIPFLEAVIESENKRHCRNVAKLCG